MIKVLSISRLGRILVTLLFLALASIIVAQAADYPAKCRVTAAKLNVRRGPGTGYSTINTLRRGEMVQVEYVTTNGSARWGCVNYPYGLQGYVSMRYVSYVAPVQPVQEPSASASSTNPAGSSWFSGLSNSVGYFFSGIWSVVRVILIILLVLVVIAFWENILGILVFMGFCAGIGALLFGFLFGNSGLGAMVGLGFAALIGLRQVLEALHGEYANILWVIYWLVSLPVYLLNRLQYFLSEPWRFMFKTSWVPDSVKTWLRPVLEVLKIVLYIATTPLRVVNAIIYNIFIYSLTSIYTLFFEVLRPTADGEGARDFWTWLYMFPVRLVKYPIYHGGISLLEGFIWTVVDTFIPTITLYHGTDLQAAEAIVRSTNRNTYLRNTSSRTCGTFTASQSSWGGIGVYFAARRAVAMSYATDPNRLSDSNPMMLVCRVTVGRIINYALAPYHVYCQAGQYGRHAELNRYGESNGYTTGEWWNQRGGYWEYCLFDWQNKYNHPWRIRPIYAFNLRTNRAQPIKGGMQHWLFEQEILDDLSRMLE